ncbi:MAG: DUF4287 domain-containing protein [Lapillicoccus sp.]
MSFQAYLDAVEKQTGKTPQQIVDEATTAGIGPDTKAGWGHHPRAGEVVTWLKTTYGIGHGHAQAISLPRKRGDPKPSARPGIGDKHVGTTGTHRDESNMLRLDGIANR